MLTILAILGVILLTINLINIFWRLPKYLMSESSLVCLQLFNAGDRFWKYCNKNWLIGFITSFLRLSAFIFATILYHTVLLMEKVKNIPAMIKSIPSKIKSLVTKTKEKQPQQNLKDRSKILGKTKEIDEISKGLLRILTLISLFKVNLC